MFGNINIKQGEFPGKGEVLIQIIFEDSYKKDDYLQLLDKKTGKKLSNKLKRHDFTGKEEQMVCLEFDGFYQHLIIIGAGKTKEFNLTKWKKLLADGFHQAQSLKHSSVTTSYFDHLGKDFSEIGKNCSLAFYLANYHFDRYKSEEERKKTNKIENLKLIIEPKYTSEVYLGALKQGIKYGKLLSEGIYLARDLVNQPASHLHPEILVEEAFKIEKESRGRISVEILDEDECRRLGMGAFLGVAQGSDHKPKFIILKYQKPKIKNNNLTMKQFNNVKICLIGKSITFDSGGLSLKPSSGMETMKIDMAGGATVLGIFKILANSDSTKYTSEVYGILPACENMPSGKAIRPGDIVTTVNNKTIEVVNTDAEGRLTLADAISYTEKYLKPDVIIDLATLTGACMVALGKEITGMFGNDEKTLDTINQLAKKEGEELWPMPLYKPYAKGLKSDIADLKNITGKGYGGAITAALFLSEFVKKSKWIHLDIAGPAFNEDSVHNIIPKGGTGWGVLTIMSFLISS